jgi:hypothetical protein
MSRGLFVRRRAELSSRPPFLPPPPPLTEDQASRLVKASNISPDFADAKGDIARAIVQVSKTDDPRKRRPFDDLLELAGNVCNKEYVQENLERVRNRLAEIKGTEEEPLGKAVRGTAIQGIALQLTAGFDEANKTHFTYDEFGNITGMAGDHPKRAPNCDAFLRGKKWRPGAPDVGYGGKKKRRQTKKKNLKKRKTSRKSMR